MQRSDNEYNRQILQAIASGERITQRSLSSDIGVALGLTNLLIRRLVAKGYVKIGGLGTRHIRYLMTTAGWEALGHATRQSLENTVHLYTQTREQIDADGQKRVLFYGAGDVAEIAYISLQSTDLALVGVVDDRCTGRFFDVEICHSDRLSETTLGSVPYAHVVVTSVRHAETILARLDERAVLRSHVSCL